MIERLFPKNELAVVKPARMTIGSFITFKGYNPLGKGNQAVHNSGSSMLKDTPTFAVKVQKFIDEHFKYSDTKFNNIHDFIYLQVNNLIRFKKDISYRKYVLSEIFPKNPFEFNGDINSDFLYISLILFFIREYNFLKSTYQSHSFTKRKCKKYYPNEQALLSKYYSQLKTIYRINYLSDICYGRYYFLEVHFSEKRNPRQVPFSLVSKYLLIKNKNIGAFDLLEQKKVYTAKPLNAKLLNELGNREPKACITKQGRKYKTDPRISKTVLKKASYQCQVNNKHMTFNTKRNMPFTEGHHLIPTSFQDTFLPINLDREENIISLCPNCHRAVHFGDKKEKEKRLKILLKLKQKELNKVKLEIDFKKLMNLYI